MENNLNWSQISSDLAILSMHIPELVREHLSRVYAYIYKLENELEGLREEINTLQENQND